MYICIGKVWLVNEVGELEEAKKQAGRPGSQHTDRDAVDGHRAEKIITIDYLVNMHAGLGGCLEYRVHLPA